MKNILPFSASLSASIFFLNAISFGQPCKVEVTGSSCTGNIITAHLNRGEPQEVLWAKNGIPFMVKTNYSSIGKIITKDIDIPSGIAFDEQDNMYVAEYRNNRIVKFASGSNTGVIVAGGNGQGSGLNQLNGPEDVQVDKQGNVYIADVYNYRIVKWAPGATAGVIVAGGNGPGSALNQFNWPNSISLDKNGNIYVADVNNNRIIKWTSGSAAGVVVAGGNVVGGSAPNQLYHPLGVFLDGSDNIYISDFLNRRVQKWAPGASAGITVAGGNGSGDELDKLVIPSELFVDENGNIFVIDSYDHSVKKWHPGKRYAYTIAGGYGSGYSPYQLYFPRGIYVKGDGKVYVAVGGDGEPGHSAVEVFERTKVADTNFYTSEKPATYKAVVYSKDDCTAISGAFKVVNMPSKPSPITGLSEVMRRQKAVAYSVQEKPGYSYEWTFPEGVEIVSGQGTSVVTVNWSDKSGFVSVHAINQCGSSEDRREYVKVTGAISSESSLKSSLVSSGTNFSIFPNPVADMLTVNYGAPKNENVQLKITGINGKVALHQSFFSVAGSNEKKIDVARLAPGIYTVSIYGTEIGMLSTKMVKL